MSYIAKFMSFVKDKWAALSLMLTMLLLAPLPASADFSSATSEVSAKFDAGETALSAVFASTIEIYVIRRVWRIIRSSI